jgi:hypothetical protein
VQALITTFALDALVMNISTPGIEANRRLLSDIQAIVRY